MSSHNSEEEFASAESDSDEVPGEVPVVEGPTHQQHVQNPEPVPNTTISDGEAVDNVSDKVEEREMDKKTADEENTEEKQVSHETETEEQPKLLEDQTVSKDTADTSQLQASSSPDSKDETTTQPPSTVPHESDKDNISEKHPEASGSGWGWGWGQSLWSTVSSAASKDPLGQLGQGLSNVFHKVEEGLGISDSTGEGVDKSSVEDKSEGKKEEISEPKEGDVKVEDQPTEEEETIAEQPKAVDVTSSKPNTRKEADEEDTQGGFWSSFGIDLTSITEASKGLVNTGLDALENVGKKTMTLLSEGDPGLRKRREMMFGGQKPTLSQLIKEAQEKTKEEEEARAKYNKEDEISLSVFLDEYQGLVHFEALELLSKESESKLRLLQTASKATAQDEEELAALAECFKVEGDADDEPADTDTLEDLKTLFAKFSLPVKVDKIVRVVEKWREVAEKDCTPVTKETEDDEQDTTIDAETIFEHALRSQGEVISCSVELLRKTAELSLLPTTKDVSSLEIAMKLQSLAKLVGQELMSSAESFAKVFQNNKSPESHSFATGLFLEAGHSCSHIQEAFGLTRPILELRKLQNVH